MISVHFQGKPFSITVIQVYAPTINAKETKVGQFSEDLHQFLELTLNILLCPFHHRGLECKSSKSRDTQNNRQVWPWSTKWSRAKNNRVLSREHADHSKYIFPVSQKMTLHMDVTRGAIQKSDWLCYLQLKMEKLYIKSAKSRRGADCGSDHELLIAKFSIKLKKSGKSTKPFRYDLH